MKLPPKLGSIHFIGIGGIGISGNRQVIHNLGYPVQGSDASDNYNVKRVADKGIKTFVVKAQRQGKRREMLRLSMIERR